MGGPPPHLSNKHESPSLSFFSLRLIICYRDYGGLCTLMAVMVAIVKEYNSMTVAMTVVNYKDIRTSNWDWLMVNNIIGYITLIAMVVM